MLMCKPFFTFRSIRLSRSSWAEAVGEGAITAAALPEIGATEAVAVGTEAVAAGEGVGSCPKALKARAQAMDEIQVLSVVFIIILLQ